MICIVDYGVGNLFSLVSSISSLGFEVRVSSSKEDIEQASNIITNTKRERLILYIILRDLKLNLILRILKNKKRGSTSRNLFRNAIII